MKQLKCEICCGNNLVKTEGFFVCQDCGAKYTVDEIKKLALQENDIEQVKKQDENAYKEINSSTACDEQNIKLLDKDKKKSIAIKNKIDNIIIICGTLIFLAMLYKFIPLFGFVKFITYCVSAVVSIIVIFGLYLKFHSNKLIVSAVCFALATLSLALNCIHGVKYGETIKDAPSSGQVYAKIYVEDDYYSEDKLGLVSIISSHIEINDELIFPEDYEIVKIPVNQPITIKAITEYRHERVPFKGDKNGTITITDDDLKTGAIKTIRVNIGEKDYCEFNLQITYMPSFWQVIFN